MSASTARRFWQRRFRPDWCYFIPALTISHLRRRTRSNLAATESLPAYGPNSGQRLSPFLLCCITTAHAPYGPVSLDRASSRPVSPHPALCRHVPQSSPDAPGTPPPCQSDGAPNSSPDPVKGVDIIHQIWPNLHPDASEVHPSQVFMARTARKCLLSGSQGGLQGLFFHTSTPPPPRPPIFQLP